MKRFQVPICVSGVWLRRIGDKAIVAVEIRGKWIDVITEDIDGNFSHIVEPNGIRSAAKR